MSYPKITPLQPEQFPPGLREQVRNFNSLLVLDEYHRGSEMSEEDQTRFLDARAKLLKAKGALIDANVAWHKKEGEKATRAWEESRRDFWKTGAKHVLSIGASLAYLVYQLVNLGWETSSIVLFMGGFAFVIGAIIYWVRK